MPQTLLGIAEINDAIRYQIMRRKQKRQLYHLGTFPRPAANELDTFMERVRDKWSERRTMTMVFNTSRGDGSHWVALRDGPDGLSYFDSMGRGPRGVMVELMRRLYVMRPGYRPQVNRRPYQRGGTECGVYAIAFCLGDEVGSDDEMQERRAEYFYVASRKKLRAWC